MRRAARHSWLRRILNRVRNGFAAFVRCAYISACYIGAMALVMIVIDRPSLRLDATLIPGRYLAVGAALVLVACLLRYVILRTGTKVVIDSERSWLVRALARLPVVLRLIATGVVAAVLLLLALRPTDGNAAHILLDKYEGNIDTTRTHAVKVLEHLVEAGREAKGAGCKPRFDTPRIETIVWQADAEGPTTALATELMDELKRLTPLNDRLEKADGELKGRRNDWVFVVSGHRGPGVSVQPWPLDPSRIRCRWKTPPEVIGAAAATKPRILHYHFTHESAMESVLELNLEVPSGTEFPSLTLALTEKGVEKWKAIVSPPHRNVPWQPNANNDGEAFGRYGDRCCYRVQLPRLGDGMVLRLTGPGWDENEVGVPQFSGRPITLGPRVLVFKPVAGNLSLLTQLKPLAADPKVAGPSPVLFDPPGDLPASAGRPVRLVRTPLSSPPPADEPTVEVIVSDMGAKNARPATLYREPAYYGTDLSLVWVEHTWAAKMPPLGEGIDLSAHRHRRVHVVSSREGQPGSPVVFQRDAANRPGWVTIVVPKLDDWQEWPQQRQQMVAFLLTWAGSLAERNGRTRPTVASETLVPADSATMLTSESGPDTERPDLAWQVLGALRGELDGRLVEPASNGIGGELIATGGLVIVLLLVPATVAAWLRTLRLRRNGLVR